jgi:hypothetical protein
MWGSRTKDELIIEVWERLDCESIGAREIEAIETVVADVFGPQAVDSPMIIARLLADEGAELRHSELMDLYVRRATAKTFEPALAAIPDVHDLATAEAAIKRLDELRIKYARDADRRAIEGVRKKALSLKDDALKAASNPRLKVSQQSVYGEIAEWLTVWIQTPELFFQWLDLRRSTAGFREMFE